MFRDLLENEDGLTSVEYALLLAAIAIAAVAAWVSLGTRIQVVVNGATSSLPAS